MKAREMVLLTNGHCPITYKGRRGLTWLCPFPICPFTNRNQINTTRHVIRHHTKEIHFECEDCGKKFQLRYSYLSHQRKHHGQQKKYPCSYCSRLLLSKIGLDIHEANHVGRKDYPCTMCDKAFSSSYALKVHTRYHTGERPYQCNFCPYLSASYSGLRSHERIHTSELPYKCSYCPRCFSSNANRFAHERRLHTFERPFVCTYCGQTFATKADLNAHTYTHKPSRELPYFCNVCKLGFNRRIAWEEHPEKCDPSNVMLCELCDRMVLKARYTAHFNKVHGGGSEKKTVKKNNRKIKVEEEASDYQDLVIKPE